ncbi:MAG: hypothetical protein AAGD18_08310 [Actinomycetota bacterium]
MATKYAPLAAFLHQRTESSIRLTFAQVERILGFTLPESARRYPAWWANGGVQPVSQQYAWLEAGWETFGLDLNAATISFRRTGTTETRQRGQAGTCHRDFELEETPDRPLVGPIPVGPLLAELAALRPVFHSEADFQHALAWQIRERWPAARIRLETRPRPRIHLDLLVVLDGVRLAFELKYLTAQWLGEVAGESFDLLGQSAHDISRYDVIKDLVRLETFVDEGYADLGWGITLTNDVAYLRPGTKSDPIDAAFRLHHGRELHGSLERSDRAGDGTTKGREAAHTLSGRYICDWRRYGELLGGDGAGQFWHLSMPVVGVRGEAGS